MALEIDLLDQLIPQSDSRIVRSLDCISRNIAFLGRMVNDVLDLGAIDGGHFAICRSRTDLCALVHDVIERVVPTRDRERVTFVADEPVTLDIDALRIERVVANLVDNALKYAVSASAIVVRLELRDARAHLAVIDDGPGIDPAEQHIIFEKYGRTTSARAHEGSGLGLYVSKSIVEAHGGRIGVDSAPGRGSRFFFDLPLG
jgi:signal transduction histidine kinase